MSSNILIRAARESDLPVLVEIYNHYIETTPTTFDVEPYTVETRRPWFDQFAAKGRYRLLVAESAGRILGYASSGPFAKKQAYETSVETSVYLAPEAPKRSGIGALLYESLFAALRGEDVHRAYGGIAGDNPASVALHVKMGFAKIGSYREVGRKFGRYWDVTWYERAIE